VISGVLHLDNIVCLISGFLTEHFRNTLIAPITTAEQLLFKNGSSKFKIF